ncbi:MAG TPA: branched-chain amino acid ABC transporter permease [Syntrophomonadaceae bacterium]|nr:branched-chain amino acid ABC transporter permease [Syntrophomonadaceae bacterium]
MRISKKEKKTSRPVPLALGWFMAVAPSLLFYLMPQSNWAFLLFLASLFVLYKLQGPPLAKGILAGVLLLAVMPIVGLQNTYYLDVITQVGIYVSLAIGLNIVVGFAGLLNFGYVAFYAFGAYFYAIFATSQAGNFIPAAVAHFPVSGNWFWLFLIVGAILTGFLGLLLGMPVLRLRGDYLAIVTMGFAEIIRILYNNMDKPINITNGPKGLTPIQPPELFGMVLNQPIHFYFIVLLVVVLTIIIAKRLDASRIGRAWAAIREDELAARAMGVQVVKMKLLAFIIGASFAGTMGVIFAAKQTFIDPSSFGFMESIGILSMVILGGMGNVSGAIIGAVAVVMLQLNILKEFSEYLGQLSAQGIIHIPSQVDPAKYEKMIYGLILILTCIYMPKGMLPVKRSLPAWFKGRQRDVLSKEDRPDVT